MPSYAPFIPVTADFLFHSSTTHLSLWDHQFWTLYALFFQCIHFHNGVYSGYYWAQLRWLLYRWVEHKIRENNKAAPFILYSVWGLSLWSKVMFSPLDDELHRLQLPTRFQWKRNLLFPLLGQSKQQYIAGWKLSTCGSVLSDRPNKQTLRTVYILQACAPHYGRCIYQD